MAGSQCRQTMQTLGRRAFEEAVPGFDRFDLMAQASEVDEDLYVCVIIAAAVHTYRAVDHDEGCCSWTHCVVENVDSHHNTFVLACS